MDAIEGFILRTIDYKDTSRLLYAYTRKGHISMIARGVKKMTSPLRHQAQTHMRLEMDLSKGNLPTLKEARLIDHYPNIKADFIRSNALYAVSELIYFNVTGDDDHEKLYPFLIKVANALDASKAPLEILAIFEMKLLHFEGIGLNLKA
ncbi:MAG: DNA repair protein RecO, partial [Bacillota bacterium]